MGYDTPRSRDLFEINPIIHLGTGNQEGWWELKATGDKQTSCRLCGQKFSVPHFPLGGGIKKFGRFYVSQNPLTAEQMIDVAAVYLSHNHLAACPAMREAWQHPDNFRRAMCGLPWIVPKDSVIRALHGHMYGSPPSPDKFADWWLKTVCKGGIRGKDA